MKTIPLNTVDGCHKTLHTRLGRLSWENFLGRIEHGGWDSQMTSIMEIYEIPDNERPWEKFRENGVEADMPHARGH